MQENKKYEIWIDSLDPETIGHAKNLGILHGVTTNPSILSKYSNAPLQSIRQTLDLFEGPLAVQVTAVEASEMVRQAKDLSALSARIIIKIPCIQEGYKAMYALRQSNIPVLATTVYTLRQYHLASYYGAKYAAPYYSRMLKLYKEVGGNGDNSALLKSIDQIKAMILASQQNQTKVMLAAIESASQLDDLLALGANVATLPAEVYNNWLDDFPKATFDLQQFSEDWNKVAKEKWI